MLNKNPLPLQVGMTLVIDHSGYVHTKKKVTIKDVLVNKEAHDGHIPPRNPKMFFWKWKWGTIRIQTSLASHSPIQVVLAAVKGSRGNPRMSRFVLQKAILHFYSECRLYPSGLVSELPSVQDWALKCAKAIVRLVLWLNPFFGRSYSLGASFFISTFVFSDHPLVQNPTWTSLFIRCSLKRHIILDRVSRCSPWAMSENHHPFYYSKVGDFPI